MKSITNQLVQSLFDYVSVLKSRCAVDNDMMILTKEKDEIFQKETN